MAKLDPNRVQNLHRYWKAANYLTIGQIYLQENPLLREPLRPEHIKPRLLGHWGTSPGLSFIYAHLNRPMQSSPSAACLIRLRLYNLLVSSLPNSCLPG